MSVEIIQQKGYNFLWIDDYLWMWDIPAEVEIQRKLAEQAHGRVLVVGLGLAVIQHMLVEKSSIDYFLTIEKNLDVYNCCKREGIIPPGHGGRCGPGDFSICDFFDASCAGEKFDFVIGDIWPEIHPDSLPLYEKFKAKAQEFLRPGGQILAWGQDYFEYLLENK